MRKLFVTFPSWGKYTLEAQSESSKPSDSRMYISRLLRPKDHSLSHSIAMIAIMRAKPAVMIQSLMPFGLTASPLCLQDVTYVLQGPVCDFLSFKKSSVSDGIGEPMLLHQMKSCWKINEFDEQFLETSSS